MRSLYNSAACALRSDDGLLLRLARWMAREALLVLAFLQLSS